MVADPTEQNNLYSSHPDLVANLTASLDDFTKGFFKNKDKVSRDFKSGDQARLMSKRGLLSEVPAAAKRVQTFCVTH